MPTTRSISTRLIASILLVGILLCLCAAVVVYLFRDQIFPLPSVTEVRDWTYAFLNAIPAPLYFLALTILPALGAPLTLFYLTALPVLGQESTLVGVLLVWLALGLNMTLTNLVTRGVFHPAIEWVIRHRHLSIPRLRPANEWKVVVAMRISPLPFALQNYVLALGHARWRTYLWMSLPIQGAIGLAVMLLGESILTGGLGYVLLALCLLLLLNIALQSLRKRLTRETDDPAP
jgi:uncharacterized membrane protein YdjX (TVP38/TMEM64 family)